MDKANVTSERPRGVRAAVLLGLFAGTATGAGFLLSGLPNLELMSLIVALSGAVLGVRPGAICGMLAAGIYSLASPYGVPAVWVLGAQMCGMAGAGTLGGLWGTLPPRLFAPGRPWPSVVAAACLGVLVTTWYEVLTNLAVLWGFGLEPRVVLIGAVPFYLIHTGSNAMIFALLFPPLATRLSHLGHGALKGRMNSGAALVLLLIFLGAGKTQAQDKGQAGTDSLTVSETPLVTLKPANTVNGWRRGLWHPFSQSLVDQLGWSGNLVPIRDGGLGASVRILGEVSTSPYPIVMRDGLPLGTGHVLADNPGLVPLAGMEIDSLGCGLDPWGGSGGWIQLHRHDPVPQDAFSSYQGTKGRHETYMRNVQLLTPQAPWRFGFEYQENLDLEGYNFTDLPGDVFDPVDDTYFPGHARLRQSHARLTRNLGPDSRLDVDYDQGRLTKDQLPALVAGHQEIWSDGVSVDMHGGTNRLGMRTAVFWRNKDVKLGPASDSFDTTSRLLETGREGALVELTLRHRPTAPAMAVPAVADSLTGPGVQEAVADSQVALRPPEAVSDTLVRYHDPSYLRLKLSVSSWTLDDTGADTTWAGPVADPVHMDGQQATATLSTQFRRVGLDWRAQAGGLWNNRLGWDSTAAVSLQQRWGRLGLRLFWETGGRAPRSDELGTILRHGVADRVLILDPNPDLKRERTMRAGGRLSVDIAGLNLAMDGVAGRLSEGITWVAATPGGDRGRLVNGANLDFQKLTTAVSHEGRFLGWGRVRYEGTWQNITPDGLPPSTLPPRRYSRLQVMWENHLFEEDGILEIALFSTHVGEMADPWDVTRSALIPSRTIQDLVLGFRLVGADLSLAFRNFTGQRYRLTSGAWGPGRETVMRLAWSFTR